MALRVAIPGTQMSYPNAPGHQKLNRVDQRESAVNLMADVRRQPRRCHASCGVIPSVDAVFVLLMRRLVASWRQGMRGAQCLAGEGSA